MTRHERDAETFTYEVSADESLSHGVVAAVSEAAGVEAVPLGGPGTGVELEPLYSVVDPDALDAVFAGTDGTGDAPRGEVTFTYNGCEVTVQSEGRIVVTPASPVAELLSD